MSRKAFSGVLILLVVVSFAVGWSPEAKSVGAPWISLETPANPMDQTSQDAALLVHAFLHGKHAGYRMVGSAEGLVDGQRRSIPLEFLPTSRPGVHAVEQQWPTDGQWLLKIGIEGLSVPQLIVELGPDGGIREGSYYGLSAKAISLRSVRVASSELSEHGIDTALRELAAATD
jgi:hypothetical protein